MEQIENINKARRLLLNLENEINLISKCSKVQQEIKKIIRNIAEFKYETLIENPTKKQLKRILGEQLSQSKMKFQNTYLESYNDKITALISLLDYIKEENFTSAKVSPIRYWLD